MRGDPRPGQSRAWPARADLPVGGGHLFDGSAATVFIFDESARRSPGYEFIPMYNTVRNIVWNCTILHIILFVCKSMWSKTY